MRDDEEDGADAKARTTLWIIGTILVLAVVVMWLFATYLSASGPVGPWVVLGSAALAGACVGRLHWISHYAFRTKTFDPLLIPHHYAWIVAGAAVVVALLALPAQTELLGVNAVPTLALAFALGVFSEETWDALHGRVRAVFGKAPRLEPALPDIDGIDVPLDTLKDAPLPENAKAAEVVAALRAHGIKYSHQLIASEKAGHLARLAKKADVPEPALKELARVGNELRDPHAVARRVAAQNLLVQTKP